MAEASLRIYRLLPVTTESDPNWNSAGTQGEVIVRAESPDDARALAAELASSHHKGGSRQDFLDNELYNVIEDTSLRYPAEGKRGMVAGTIRAAASSSAEIDEP
ncbi:hypothetical protein M8997_000675 [Phyllobacterium sp. 21LDTY02-6]|uniref:hypothetical protein n=1 Tax=Phyllobacterium sp. 21LDTY02-6 TaxID=2944903 RepID=UPI002020BB0D|nr:hypothetical protein [Phyllobacterium sp. 21LDTY02-6]MCO4315680.1 hypothetical protein [Phyllobacterium sp. 21LDTY02-6]